MPKFIDLTGQTFGRWKVLTRGGSRKWDTYWLCRCECGHERDVASKTLRSGHSTGCPSCGAKRHARPTPDALRFQYVEMKRSTTDLSEMYGCSPITVSRWLHETKIPIRANGVAHTLSTRWREAMSVRLCGQTAILNAYNRTPEARELARGNMSIKKATKVRVERASTWLVCRQCNKTFKTTKGAAKRGRKCCNRVCAAGYRAANRTPLPAWLKGVGTSK